MDFKPNYPIYLQVADYICEKVLKGELRNGDRLPALKDLAVTTSVNPNTVIKALGFLVDHNILSTQRGVGYFMTDNARAITLDLKRKQFIEEVLPDVFNKNYWPPTGLLELTLLYEELRPASFGAPAGSAQ